MIISNYNYKIGARNIGYANEYKSNFTGPRPNILALLHTGKIDEISNPIAHPHATEI